MTERNTKNIIAFAQNLHLLAGGAERSLIEILKTEYPPDTKIELIFFKKVKGFASAKNYDFPTNWKLTLLTPPFSFRYFSYLEYWLNKRFLRKEMENKTCQDLHVFSIYGPVAIQVLRSANNYYYIHSEVEFGEKGNYETGVRKWFKYLYLLLEFPFRKLYKSELKKAFQRCDIICNSQFTAEKFYKKFKIKPAAIRYPIVKVKELKAGVENKSKGIRKGVVFIGHTSYKGMQTAKIIAENMPEQQFYFFNQLVKNQYVEGNIYWKPWRENLTDVYKYADLVIVPSLCEETFGRVAREAYDLEIPVVASKIGGLPEAVYMDDRCLIEDFKNIDAWVMAIQAVLNHENASG